MDEKSKKDTKKQGGETVSRKAPRLFVSYNEKVLPNIQKRFELKSRMQVPKLDKIKINCGVGQATQDQKLLEEAVDVLRTITGQQPVITKSKKAISNFKLREDQPIGCAVTLRGKMMYEFFDRLVNITLPRVRDFRGLKRKSFDGHGNYSMGIKEQLVFNEISAEKVNKIMGMDITICTTAKTDEHALVLLEEMGLPFRKQPVGV